MKPSLITLGLLVASQSYALNIKNLELNCRGSYKVLSATPFFHSNLGTRRPFPDAGATESIEVLGYNGPDCQKMEDDYGLYISVGTVLEHTQSLLDNQATPESAATLAKFEIGKVHVFMPVHQFAWADPQGNLLLYPLIHSEYVSLLDQEKNVDSLKIHGVPGLEDLDETQKQALIGKVNGLLYDPAQAPGYASDGGLNSELLDLMLKLKPQTDEEHYLWKLWGLFGKASGNLTSFTTGHQATQLGSAINAIMATDLPELKMDYTKKHPMLFDEQIGYWLTLPQLNETEIEEYLEFALVKSQQLAPVGIVATQVLLDQYKASAANIEVFSSFSYGKTRYVLSPQAKELIAQIKAVK